MSYCVRLKPDQQNVLMAGTADKKIVQWDMDTGDLVQVSSHGTHCIAVKAMCIRGRAECLYKIRPRSIVLDCLSYCMAYMHT